MRLSASIWQEGNQFVSLCPELGVASCGASPMEALGMLKEAVELYLEKAKEYGFIDELSETISSPFRFQSSFEVELT
jgi:predicted RNase H-like HicB family nuclease